MGRIFQNFMTSCAGGSNMRDHMIKYLLDDSELVMMDYFYEDANYYDDEIIRCRAKDLNWSPRKFKSVFSNLKQLNLVNIKQQRRANAEITLNYKAMGWVCDIMKEYPRLRHRLRAYIGNQDVMSFSKSDIRDFDRQERKRLKSMETGN